MFKRDQQHLISLSRAASTAKVTTEVEAFASPLAWEHVLMRRAR